MFNDSLDVDEDISELLVNNNFRTLEEVAYVDKNELLSIVEFDEDIVNELQDRAKNKLLGYLESPSGHVIDSDPLFP